MSTTPLRRPNVNIIWHERTCPLAHTSGCHRMAGDRVQCIFCAQLTFTQTAAAAINKHQASNKSCKHQLGTIKSRRVFFTRDIPPHGTAHRRTCQTDSVKNFSIPRPTGLRRLSATPLATLMASKHLTAVSTVNCGCRLELPCL